MTRLLICSPIEQPIWISFINYDVDHFSVSNDAAYAIVGNTVVPLYPAGRPRPLTRLAIESGPSGSLTTIMDSNNLHITALTFQPGQVFRGTFSNDLSSGSISLRVDSEVTLEASALGSQQVLKLLALPQWPGLEHTFAVFRLPEEGSAILNIVLNQAASSSYDMSKKAAQNFPLVVDRHVGAIRRPVVTGNRLRVIENMGKIRRPVGLPFETELYEIHERYFII
jgi:hypothetical protein